MDALIGSTSKPSAIPLLDPLPDNGLTAMWTSHSI